MKKRSVAAVVILSFVTFGIYSIYWFVETKGEMVRAGAEIPTAWLSIIPIANIYWQWKWSGGVEQFTHGKTQQAIAFILIFLLGVIGMAIVQAAFNKAIDEGARGELAVARIA